MGRRIGILGGTFDPIHSGHLSIAREALRSLSLEQVLFIPSARPPHKPNEGMTPPDVRARMVLAALKEEPRFELSRIEMDREGVSYTVDTLRDLRAAHRDVEWFLIIGGDNAVEMDTWHQPEQVASLATVVVVSRRGADREHVPGALRDRMHFLETELIDVSSTEIRERLQSGKPVDGLLPPAVAQVIQEEHLYA